MHTTKTWLKQHENPKYEFDTPVPSERKFIHTRDEEWSGPAGGADVPPEEVHQAAEQAGIAWDGDEAFMDFSEKITGFRHIDTMTSELRLKLIDALKHAVPQIN